MKFMSKEEFMKRVGEMYPDSDEKSLENIEFLSDFYDNADKEISENDNGTAVAAAVAENEEKWRAKYRARFFEGTDHKDENDDFGNEPPEIKTFDSLFE